MASKGYAWFLTETAESEYATVLFRLAFPSA